MRRKTSTTTAALVISTAVGVLFGFSAAQAQTVGTLTIAAPSMVPVRASTHTPACGSAVTPTGGAEFQGVLLDAAGSFLSPVNLPQNATVTGISVSAHDFTDPGDVHLFLVRKFAGVQANFTDKYAVMASVASSGFDDSQRKFTTHHITNAVIDNSKFSYFVELVNCDSTIQPVAVQIGFTTAAP